MLDTVILSIPAEKFVCVKDDKALEWDLHSKSRGFEKHVKHQTAIQKVDGVYRPRIRLIRRPGMLFMQMEFSVPKLLFKNNVDEVCDDDFEKAISILKKRLEDFGVMIREEVLREADVSVFHPSKNFILSDGYTSGGIIKELNKINLTRRMDLTNDTFRNEGQSLQYYTNSHSLVIYDKLKDLKKSKKRAIDKDQTFYQTSLFDELEKKKETEILRIEVRLSKKVKMNSIMQKIGEEKNPNFKDIFKKEVCQKIVQLYWNDLILEKNLFLFSLASDPVQTMNKILKNNSKIKPKELIYLVGLQELCRGGEGVRDLRLVIEKISSSRTWFQTAKNIKKLNSMQSIEECHSWIKQVNEQLEEFESVKLEDLQCNEK
jgi:hypothetical protein